MLDIIEQLKISNKPIFRVMHDNDQCKLMAVGLNRNVVLEQHKTDGSIKLVVVKGLVKYTTKDRRLFIRLYEEFEIPSEEEHEIVALDESILLLIF